jgi:4-hydroxyphenylpyruvate dioxygenase
MRKSIATVSLSGTLEEKLAVAAQTGFDGVEIFESDLVNCPSSPAEVRRRATDLGLRIELYQPFRDFEAMPSAELTRNLRRAEHKFQLMNELGADLLLVCSNVSPAATDDDALAAEQLRQLADLAAGHDIRVAYEALAWGRHVSDYLHSWKIVQTADHPNLGLCLDSFHILSRPVDPGGIRGIPGEKIFFLQLADAPHMLMDVLQWSRHYRCFPGQGRFDLSGLLDAVLATGYQGPLSLEVFNDVFRQADAERTATDGMRSLLNLEDSLQRRPGVPQGAGDRGQPKLRKLPSPVKLTGFAFAEIAVDPLSEMAAERFLEGMGFARAGRHHSKPVQLWQQGDARVLLNRTHSDASDWHRGDAKVSAIAVESPDPAQSAKRAEALLASPIPRKHGPGEADLAAVAAPDGTSVFFCRTDARDRSGWLGDFEPIAALDRSLVREITGLDHIAHSQPPHSFDEATQFYQSVFGLRQRSSEEVADPYGLVRSRAMTSAGNGLRLVLNVPLLGGGQLPETAALQHVAFACADIFTAARRMRAGGLRVLPIPANYYDDLAARLELDASLLEAMREHEVLYDHSESGEFFHFYTGMLSRRMFFEIVQRLGDYEGFGAANTPVRMAAQYRHMAMPGVIEM